MPSGERRHDKRADDRLEAIREDLQFDLVRADIQRQRLQEISEQIESLIREFRSIQRTDQMRKVSGARR